jgi:hypothetical protein
MDKVTLEISTPPPINLTIFPQKAKINLQINPNLYKITGPSNYEIAVKNGFTGSESEWLLTLQSPVGNILTYPAGEALGGHRIVILKDGKFFYADKDNATHLDLVVGMTTGAAELDSNVIVLCRGEISEPSWDWEINKPLYLSNNGLLTVTPITSGFSLICGMVITPTKINLCFSQAIIKI